MTETDWGTISAMLARIVSATLTVATTVATLAAVPAVASAPTSLRVALASTVYADGLLRQAVSVADGYWAAHGRPLPCQATVLLYDAPNTDKRTELATIPGCKVGFRRSYRGWLGTLCAMAVHARGHMPQRTPIDGWRWCPRSAAAWWLVPTVIRSLECRCED